MKLVISLLSVMIMVSGVFADIPAPNKGPQLPPDLPYDVLSSVQPRVMPVVDPSGAPDFMPPPANRPVQPSSDAPVPPASDLPGPFRPVIRPGRGLGYAGVLSVRPYGELLLDPIDAMPPAINHPLPDPNDLPRPYRPVIRPSPKIGKLGEGVLSESKVLPVVRDPQPFFRNRLELDFGPYRGRIKVELKMYDMNGRQVLRQDVVASGKVVIGEPVSSLAAGSYIAVLDCGGVPFFRAKLEKVD